MTTWTAPQAEAWMREHPGRWLEDHNGRGWYFDGRHGEFVRIMPGDGDPVSWGGLATHPTLTFHPPREHYAAEVESLLGYLAEKCAKMEGQGDYWPARVIDVAITRLRALFPAAPEVDGE